MTKYVDTEKAEAQLRAYADNVPKRFGEVIKGLIDAVVLDLTDAIKNIPVADVQENVKGEWTESSPIWAIDRYKCSLCKRDTSAPFNFCPHCGADMRGGNNG